MCGAKADGIAKTAGNLLSEHLQLNPTHYMYGDVSTLLGNRQGGILILKDAKGLHHAECQYGA